MKLIDGQLWSPFYIMVKDYGKLTINELFDLLKIDSYSYRIQEDRIEIGSNSSDVLFVIRRGDWIQVMDNWGYKLWHNKQIKQNIEHLSKSFELFQFSIGDIDYDYDFSYYRNGELIRKFAIEVRSNTDITVKEDFGTPLIGEPEINELREPFEILIPIAKAIGISFNHKLNEIEVYSESKNDLLKSENK